MNDIHDMTEAIKAEFLAAFRAQFGFGEMTATANDDAAAMLKAAAWAWQASREAVVVELPKSRADAGETANGDQILLSALMANHLAIEQCKEAIEAQGVKCK